MGTVPIFGAVTAAAPADRAKPIAAAKLVRQIKAAGTTAPKQNLD